MRTAGIIGFAGWIMLGFCVETAQAQSDWGAVQALTAGQRIRAIAEGRQVSGDFQCATEDLLVLSRSVHIVYLDRSQVQSVATVTRERSYRWTAIGVAVGIPWGMGTAISGGLKSIPIVMATFGAIGAWIDFSNNRHEPERVVTVYRVP
jgi:hypothetical protein